MCSVSAHLGCGSLYRLAAAFLAAALTLSMNCLAAYSPIYCLSSGSIYKVQVELFIVPFLSKKGRTYMPWLSPFFKNKNHIAWLVTCRSFVSAVRCSESRTLGSFSPENPSHPSAQSTWATTGVNKKPKNFKTVWHGFWGILKLSGRVNQASLKLSASFSISVCWTYKSDYMGNRTMTVPNCCRISNKKILRLFSMHIFSKLKNLDVYTLFNTSTV